MATQIQIRIGMFSKFIIIYLLLFDVIPASSKMCYSCSGTCHNEPCNCQMGSCQANECFIEKKPTEIKGVMQITKGCLRKKSRIYDGCEYDHFADHILCVCKGNFCNDRVTPVVKTNHVVQCRHCSEKNPECGETCNGYWCHEDLTTGAAGCGYGPPALPFYYRTPDIFYYRSKKCVTLSRGAGKPRRHCICNTNMCNTVYNYNHMTLIRHQDRERENSMRSRSVEMSITDGVLPLHTCVSCETNSMEPTTVSMTTSCKTHRCLGHFCTYAAQQHMGRINGGRTSVVRSLSELQGCLNVSDIKLIQLGCSRKWISDEYEEMHCACSGNLCNIDSVTASSFLVFSLTQCLLIILFFLLNTVI